MTPPKQSNFLGGIIMKTTFGPYDDIPEVAPEGTTEAETQQPVSAYDPKSASQIKKTNNRVKKLWKIAKKEAKAAKKKKESFFDRLGDVILKAVPKILTTIAAGLCAGLFGKMKKAFA